MRAPDTPEAVKALSRAVYVDAVRRGERTRPTECEACGSTTSVHGHHKCYCPACCTDVIGLCAACHAAVHAGWIPEPRTGFVYGDRPTEITTLGALIRSLRLRVGMSQPAFGEAVGMDASGVCRWESGQRGVSVQQLSMILAVGGATDEERILATWLPAVAASDSQAAK